MKAFVYDVAFLGDEVDVGLDNRWWYECCASIFFLIFQSHRRMLSIELCTHNNLFIPKVKQHKSHSLKNAAFRADKKPALFNDSYRNAMRFVRVTIHYYR
jgi:hypothetical protein